MDEKRLRQRLEEDLLSKVRDTIDSPERKQYEGKLREWDARYHASRSIAGLLQTGEEDPRLFPLDEPFDGCADVGHPIEMTLTQELVPNIMAAHMGATPFTESRRATDRGLQPAGEIDDFIYYAAERAGLKGIRRQTALSGYKYGEAIEKLVFVPEVRTVTDDRLFLATNKGKKVLISPDGKPVELFDPDTDLSKVAKEMLSGDDPRSQMYRNAVRSLKLPPKLACEAAGIEVKGDIGNQTMRVAPLGKPMAQGQPPVPDWDKSTTYTPTVISVTEDIEVSKWPKWVKIPTKDFIVPNGVETNDIMAYWNCHRYQVDLGWLVERKKKNEKDTDGFYPDVVDQIVSNFKAKDAGEKNNKEESRPEIWEVYASFVMNADDESADDYMQETEIIAWFCNDNDSHPLLGWMVNPAVRYPIHHIRPFFVFQPKPEDDRFHGLGIPETSAGFRETADWLLNKRLNSHALYSDPIIIQDEKTFMHEQNLKTAPGARWLKEVGGVLDVVNINTVDSQGMTDENFMIQALRLMWGASEQMSGLATKTDSGTATEANLIAAKGARMFQDTVESFSQVADLQYEYIRQFYIHNEPSDVKMPVSQPDSGSAALVDVTSKMFEGEVLIRSRRVLVEGERHARIAAIGSAMQFLANTQSPLMRSPMFMEQMIKEYFDALNLENVDLPTKEQLMQEQAQMQMMVRQADQQKKLLKAAQGIENKGARNIVEKFIQANSGGPGMNPNMNLPVNPQLLQAGVR